MCQLMIIVPLKQDLLRPVRPLIREREARTNGLIRTRDMEHGVTVIGNVMAAALVILSGERNECKACSQPRLGEEERERERIRSQFRRDPQFRRQLLDRVELPEGVAND